MSLFLHMPPLVCELNQIKMIDYNQLFDNPLFFKWIFYPSPEIDAYWNHYLENHKEAKEKINELKSQIELHLKYDQKKLSEQEKKSLVLRIGQKLDQADAKKIRGRIVRRIFQYAAIAFTFFFIGGSLTYLYLERRQPQLTTENSVLPAQVQEPVLILGDRRQVTINEGESQLEYLLSGEITINGEKTLKEEFGQATSEYNTLVIPYGSRSTITLSDGTKIWLNAGSRLIYPSIFMNKTREVFLIGEAYFDVSKNESQPFVVKTPDMQLEVLGTKFNVVAYPEDFAVQAILTEGSVEIKSTAAGRREKGTILEPGYLAYFNKKTMEISTQQVNVDEYTLWTKGLFSFSNTDFNRITKKLERYYNLQFQFDDPFKGGIQVSGKLDVTKDRAEVFSYLERLTGLQIIALNERHYLIK